MITAFQSNAFQNNAFQIGIASTGGGGGNVLSGGGGLWHSIQTPENAIANGAILTLSATLIPGSATFAFDGELLDTDLIQLS